MNGPREIGYLRNSLWASDARPHTDHDFRAFQRREGVSPYRWRCRHLNQPEAGRH